MSAVAEPHPALRPTPVVSLADAAQRDDVAGVLLAAFADDPAARWVWPDDSVYREAFSHLIDALGGAAFAHRSAYLANGDEGAALWLPPGTAPDDAAIEALVKRTVGGAAQDATFAIFEEMGRAHPAGPHWYLPFVGVTPGRQGQGIGSALLEAALTRCDADALPAYLESTNPRNVPLYRRYGFEVTGEIQAGDCPPLIPMIRPARR
jgi:GNAT superfamily N-acetyltransferase